jgi:hypothetical protein
MVLEALNALNRIAVKEICVIIVAKVVLIGQTILTQVAQFPCIVVQHVGQFVKSFE